MNQLDQLDKIAESVAKGNESAYGVLSTGERLYVALAANRAELLREDGYTIAEALARIGPDWTALFTARWQYKGDPSK